MVNSTDQHNSCVESFKQIIGIITFHHSANYGGSLQAYSLWRFLKEAGNYVEIINYCPWRVSFRERLRACFSLSLSRHILRQTGQVSRKILLLFKRNQSRYQRLARMNAFLAQRARMSGSAIYFRNKLRGLAARYDTIVVGSDEVWKINPGRANDWSYFLDFALGRCRCISYAASCGQRQSFGQYQNQTRSLLSLFCAISVRDDNTAGVI